MKKQTRRCALLRFIPLSFFLAATPVHADAVNRELTRLVSLAMAANPQVVSARRRVDRATEAHAATDGFRDPQFQLAVGRADETRGIPGTGFASGLRDEAIVASAGVEIALPPGAYLDVGISERYLTDPGTNDDSLYQTFLGAGLQVPLWRDRRFRAWRAEQRAAAAAEDQARNALLATQQRVRHDVETAYITVMRAVADEAVVAASLTRASDLAREADELVRMEVIPDYQALPAQVEVALRREELETARHTANVARIRLTELLGPSPQSDAADCTNTLAALAAADPPYDPVPFPSALAARAAYKELASRRRVLEAERDRLRELAKPDVSLLVAATWQAEAADEPFGTEALVTGDRFGSEVAVVWRRPLRRTRELADLRGADAALAESAADCETVRLRIAAEWQEASSALASARARLDSVTHAVLAAERTLEAESERFRLGEGRSRQVLDAQKDLTATIRSRNSAAAALLRARADGLHAAGYPGWRPLPKNEAEEDTTHENDVQEPVRP